MELDPSTSTTSETQFPLVGEFSEYWELGRRCARRWVPCESDCDEIVQEVVYRLLARQEGTEPIVADRTRWLGVFVRSIRNLCIDRLRRQQVRNASEFPVDQLRQHETMHPLMAQEQMACLNSALERLPENWRQALMMRAEESLSYDQIAERMEITKAQVRTWIFRARRQLLEELADELGA